MKNSIQLMMAFALVGVLAACTHKAPTATPRGWQEYPDPAPAEWASYNLPAKRPKTKVLTQFASSTITSFTPDTPTEITTQAINATSTSASTTGEVVKPTYTIVFNANKAAPMRAQNALGTMKTDEPDELEVGTIIVSAPTEEAPTGFMQKITNVTYEPDGDAVVKTEMSTLAEVIAGSDLTPEQVEAANKVSIPMKAQMVQDPNAITPQWVLLPYDSGQQCVGTPTGFAGGTVESKACVEIAFWLDVRIDIGWRWAWFVPYPYLEGFGSTANGYVDVLASFKAGAATGTSASSNVPLGTTVKLADFKSSNKISFDSGAVTFWIGIIPVVIVPKLSLAAGVRGGMSLSASASANVKTTIPDFWIPLGTPNNPVSFGFYCTSSFDCKKVNTMPESLDVATYLFENWKFPSNPIELNAKAEIGANLDVKAFASLEASAYLYGVAGLSAGIEAYVGPEANFKASITATSNLSTVTLSPIKTQFSAGIWAGMDGYLSAGVSIFNWTRTADLYRGSIVPRTRLGGIDPMCWENATRLAKCP